jgi:hypothetical protein
MNIKEMQFGDVNWTELAQDYVMDLVFSNEMQCGDVNWTELA